MPSKKTISPPAFADWLLTWYCGNAFMEDIRGDLDELFQLDVQNRGMFRARISYWRHAFSLVSSYTVARRKQHAAFHAYSYTSFNPDMFKNYFLVMIRSLMKSKLYIAINIFGLAIATSCCVIAYLNYHFNADFDDYHPNASQIYRVSSLHEFQGQQQLHGIAPMALGSIAHETMPGLSGATRYNYSSVSLKLGDDLFNENIRYVDPDFFKIFNVTFIEGTPPKTGDGNKLYISDQVALKLFGSVQAVGKSVSQVIGNTLKPYEIGGVYKKPPMNSSFIDGGYALYSNYFDESPDLDEHSWSQPTTLFVKVEDPTKVPGFAKNMQRYVENYNHARGDVAVKSFILDPFEGMSVRDTRGDTRNRWTHPAISDASVYGCNIMSVVVLMIACFNLTNTTLATSSRRVREIGVRKVMGSHRRQLIFQFLGETAIVCTIALLAGLWMTSQFLLPGFNSLWPYMKLQTDYFGPNNLLLSMVGVLILMVLIAGAYPAFYISRFEPVKILKGTFRFQGMTNFSLVLLSLQFVISLIGIISSLAFVQNAKYQRSINLGFNEHVVYTQANNGQEAESLGTALREQTDITAIGYSRHTIGWSIPHTLVKSDATTIEADVFDSGDNYLRTAGVTFVAGRDFEKDSGTDKKESVIISEGFAQAMGWSDPIGKKVVMQDTIPYYVIGVVKDVYSRGLWRKVEPTMFRYIDKQQCAFITASAPPEKLSEVNVFMEKKWKELFPNRVYDGQFANAAVVEAITVNENILTMFVFIGAVAMLLSGTGLFTLVSLSIVKRFKEIGIRKVMGASASTIVRLVNTRFIVVLLISSALGCWMASLAVEPLMRGIWAFYQPPLLATFLSGAAFLLIISFITISSKIYEVVRMNPVNSLRTE